MSFNGLQWRLFANDILSIFLFDFFFQNDKTALHIAAEEGHLHAVMRLIDLRCDIDKRDIVSSLPGIISNFRSFWLDNYISIDKLRQMSVQTVILEHGNRFW